MDNVVSDPVFVLLLSAEIAIADEFCYRAVKIFKVLGKFYYRAVFMRLRKYSFSESWSSWPNVNSQDKLIVVNLVMKMLASDKCDVVGHVCFCPRVGQFCNEFSYFFFYRMIKKFFLKGFL